MLFALTYAYSSLLLALRFLLMRTLRFYLPYAFYLLFSFNYLRPGLYVQLLTGCDRKIMGSREKRKKINFFPEFY